VDETHRLRSPCACDAHGAWWLLSWWLPLSIVMHWCACGAVPARFRLAIAHSHIDLRARRARADTIRATIATSDRLIPATAPCALLLIPARCVVVCRDGAGVSTQSACLACQWEST